MADELSILLVGPKDEPHIAKLSEALAKSARVLVLDPCGNDCTVAISRRQVDIKVGGVHLTDVNSIFCLAPFQSQSMDPSDDRNRMRKSMWDQWLRFLDVTLPESYWMNRPTSASLASNLGQQYRVACSVGLNVPEYLISSDVGICEQFLSLHPSCIIKPGNIWTPPNRRYFTNRVVSSDLNPRNVASAPCLFQEYIEKSFELRIYVIGEEVVTCRIDSQASTQTALDWRRYDIPKTPHSIVDLPAEITANVQCLVQKLGLAYGAIDMIVTPKGEFYFLECNSEGRWLWIEALTGANITEIICRALCNQGHGSS
ncbi:MAG: hypothetical protein NTX72_00100 [Candidatus Uhrbacteria bacterium]|nr:hypothetical protein [Candidatus Uhrbacteria bacterium]